jgi:hypothetical protein
VQLAVTRAALTRLALVGALLAPLGGCISELVVEVQPPSPPPGQESDAGVDEEDAGPVEIPDSGPIDIPDSEIVGIGPAQDAGVLDSGRRDAAVDAGTPDATRDSGPVVVLEAGTDAGCKGGACDAGAPPGPCQGGCDVTTLVTPECDGGGPQVCWSNPDAICTFQCPSVQRCSPTVPCAGDEWCFYDSNDCGDSGRVGYCAKRRATCGDNNLGVCGCDGVRYPNSCVANQAGTSVRAGAVCK